MTIKEQQDHALQQELLTVEQVSLLTQYHVKSIYRMIGTGGCLAKHVVRLNGWSIRIPRSILKALRARHPRADQSLTL